LNELVTQVASVYSSNLWQFLVNLDQAEYRFLMFSRCKEVVDRGSKC